MEYLDNKVLINEIEANQILQIFADNFEWVDIIPVICLPEKRYILGTHFATLSRSIRIELYGIEEGMTLETLIHEIAHFKEWNHSDNFKKVEEELRDWWDTFEDDIIDQMNPKGDPNMVIEYLVDEFLEGETITRGMVGSELKEAGLPNSMLSETINQLKEIGVKIN